MNRSKILYIPGWASGRNGEQGLVDALRSHYETEVLWLPNIGSDWTPSQPIEMIYTPRLIERIDTESEPVTLIGWSIGGMAALELAAARPSRIKSLVLISTTAKFCADETRLIGSSSADLDKLKADLLSFPDKALRRFFTMCLRPERPDKETINRRVGDALDATVEQLALGLDHLKLTDLRPILDRISCPTLLLHGDMDEVVPVEAAEELRQTLPDSQLHVVPGQGHLLPDATGCTLAHIADFLREN